MKSKQFFFTSVIFFIIIQISCNDYYSKALKDITSNNISAKTITNLENAKSKKNKKIISYYQLARIYHYNPALQDIDKAKEYYEYLINNYNNVEFKSQFDKLNKQYNVTLSTFQTALKDVNDLIDTRTYNSYVKINTLDGYKEFITKYPTSNHLTDAKDMAFQIATKANTLEVYKEYIDKFPNYRTTEAEDKAFAKACSDNTYPVYTDFINKFPSYKTKALEKAYEKAIKMNTYEEYQNYLAFFPDYRTSDIHLKIFAIVKKTNTIEAFEKFITDFPKSNLIANAKSNIELIIVKQFDDYVFKNYSSWKERLLKIDEFYSNNSQNIHIDTLLEHIKSMAFEMIYEESKIKSLYSEISPLKFDNTKVFDMVVETFSYSIMISYRLDINNLSAGLDSIDFEDCNDVKIKMTKRVNLFNYIANSYSKLMYKEWVDVLKKNSLKEDFVIKLCPMIDIYKNFSDYSDAKHKSNVKNINALLNNSKYSSIKDICQNIVDYVFGTVEIVCSNCKGTGRVTGTKCPRCKGRGEINCDYCTTISRNEQSDSWGTTTVDGVDVTVCCAAGRLKYDNYDINPPVHYDEVCPKCHGTMKIDCPVCGGYGTIDICPVCGGDGTITKNYLEIYK